MLATDESLYGRHFDETEKQLATNVIRWEIVMRVNQRKGWCAR